jgi:hypothetical protein
MKGTIMPTAADFFASREGVCVYVTLENRSIRVCFRSPQEPGTVAEDAPLHLSAKAIEKATAAFVAYRVLLMPLFETISNATGRLSDAPPVKASRH